MKFLLRSVKVVDTKSTFNDKVVNILIEDGVIKNIGTHKVICDHEYDCKGLLISNGWCDMWAHFNDPGEEHKEDIYSGIGAAIAGGYTSVSLLPNTRPVVQEKSGISYMISKSLGYPLTINPYCAVSDQCKGEELTEMIDANHSGAVAFTDGIKPIWHTDIFLKALIYMQKFDGLLINKPEEKWLSQFGSMHEGTVSTVMGLKGMPAVAEEIMIERDLRLLRYAEKGRVHFATISTRKSVDLIRNAKKEGLDVTCSVSIWNLLYTDSNVEGYKTDFKLNPPLRTKEDRKALIKGIKDDTIDVIVSNHQAHDEECKKLEFDLADFGAIALQTMLPCILNLTPKVEFEKLLEKVTRTPREILKLKHTSIEEGSLADLTLFDPELKWYFNEKSNQSKSINSPLYNQELTGKVQGVILGEKHYFDSSLTS